MVTHHTGSSKETGPIMIVYGIKGKCQGPSQVTYMEQPKLAQVDKMTFNWFTPVCSEHKHIQAHEN